MGKVISIDPITRLEGHGKIDIFLNDDGNVDRAFLQIPELRGFEKFVEGRRTEEMPQITSRICGVCPTAHHMAATKALDSLYKVVPTPAARTIRELFYNLFMFEDHLLHFYFLGGPDFIVGPDAPKKKRNILGVIDEVGIEMGKKVIEIRKRCRALMAELGGKPVHPVLGLPGGVAKQVTEEARKELADFAVDAVEFARITLKAFNDIVLENKSYLDLILSESYYLETSYMGMVDDSLKINFYDGDIRVVDQKGKEIERFKHDDYADIIAEHVEPWTYIKFPYLRKIGWKGIVDGTDSGIYRVAPLARLNASEGMATPIAQEEYERLFETIGSKPVHNTLANHWARLVETLYAAEHLVELSGREELTSPDIRNMDLSTPDEGVGIVEAPRGTLIHHYEADERGIITAANLIVATVANSAAMNIGIERAAKKYIRNGEVNDGLLNMVEMAFRAYDPCLSCATHSLPGKMPLQIRLMKDADTVIGKIIRD
ncbi:MAG: Ni/Fe hydrogenase subunit alpha [Candidatus Krumholzibacteriota bacterium]|nr:Ni/Fe hydrogenase subunit alpha [Candidatus Krumholzibacteriota bacterium]